MTMKARLVFALGLLALSCGGGSESKPIPQAEACPEASKAICAKLFSCNGDTFLDLAKTAVGGDEVNCLATVQQNNCASFTCATGQTYHGDKAGMCKDQFSGVSCSQLSREILTAGGDVNVLIKNLAPSCNQVCS
jgi:hypothetical protein